MNPSSVVHRNRKPCTASATTGTATNPNRTSRPTPVSNHRRSVGAVATAVSPTTTPRLAAPADCPVGRRTVPSDTVTRFVCVDDLKATGFPESAVCEAAGVSTSGYYDWDAREAAGPTVGQLAEAELVAMMRQTFDDADGNYGVPRMYKALRRAGLGVNKKRVARLMRRHGMAGRQRRRKCRTTFPGPDAGRSSAGSTGTTRRGFTAASTTPHPRVGTAVPSSVITNCPADGGMPTYRYFRDSRHGIRPPPASR